MFSFDKQILNDLSILTRNSAFENLYIYLTNQCNFHCKHCYLGNRLAKKDEMELETVYNHLETWRSIGSNKICFIGGEPTLYPYLREAIIRARVLKYEKIIIGSNGSQIALNEFKKLPLNYISYIQISLDGATANTHDQIRQKGAFDETIKTIEYLVKSNVDVRIIMTVNNLNAHEMLPMIKLGEKLGVSLVKFHIMSKIGVAQKSNVQAISPESWIELCKRVRDYCDSTKLKIRILYQPAYASIYDDEFVQNYNGCIGKNLERISVFPDGKCYICSFLFDYDICYASLVGNIICKNVESEYDKFDIYNCELCKKCDYNGCVAENIVNGYDFCENNKGIYPICRLWKLEIESKK